MTNQIYSKPVQILKRAIIFDQIQQKFGYPNPTLVIKQLIIYSTAPYLVQSRDATSKWSLTIQLKTRETVSPMQFGIFKQTQPSIYIPFSFISQKDLIIAFFLTNFLSYWKYF